MKKFLSCVALFLAPVLLFVSLFGYIVYASGEWRSEEEIVQRVLSGEPAFLGLAYRDNTRYYKHLVASGKKADLLVLGTSRSMQFHSEFFNTDSFYNAGGAAAYVHEFQFFLENLPEDALPDTLLIVLDQYFFEEGWSNVLALPELDYSHYTFDAGIAVPEAIRGWANGKYSLLDALKPHENMYGMAAVGRGSGFYADGSYSYGKLMDHPEDGTDVGFHDSFDRITHGINRFEYADTVYQPSLDTIASLLEWCHAHNIQVVGIIPPYAPSVYNRMMETGRYGYINQMPQALGEMFEPYGYELFDFSYMPDTADDQYIDGYHGGDRVYAALTLQLAEKSRILQDKIDTDYLNRSLAPNDNPLRLTQ